MKTYLIAFLDLLLCMMFVVLMMVNPKAQDAKEVIQPPGNLMVTVTWPSGDDDVDLWIQGPDDESPVGYSNKNGALSDLLRDDLGEEYNGALGLNYENAYTKGLPDGDYAITVHAFAVYKFPLPIEVEVAYRPASGGASRVIVLQKVTLDFAGEEETIIRFKILNGELDKSSVHRVPIKLRTGTK